MDEVAPVVCRDYPHALGERRLELFYLLLHPLYHIEDILAKPHYDDSARHLSLSVKLRDPAPYLGAEFYRGDIPEIDGSAGAVYAHLILLDEPPDTRHLRDAGHAL